MSVSIVGWIAVGLGIALVVLAVVGIWCYPRDNSF